MRENQKTVLFGGFILDLMVFMANLRRGLLVFYKLNTKQVATRGYKSDKF